MLKAEQNRTGLISRTGTANLLVKLLSSREPEPEPRNEKGIAE